MLFFGNSRAIKLYLFAYSEIVDDITFGGGIFYPDDDPPCIMDFL